MHAILTWAANLWARWCAPPQIDFNPLDYSRLQGLPAPPPQHSHRAALTDRKREKLLRPQQPVTLAALLGELGETFENLKCGAAPGSWVPRGTRAALKKMGVWVPPPFSWDTTSATLEERTHTTTTQRPSIICVALNRGKQSDAQWMYPDFGFATKIEKLPWNVSYEPGQAYACGLAYRSTTKHHHWTGYYVAIDKTGMVRACEERVDQAVTVGRGRYTLTRWQLPAVFNGMGSATALRRKQMASYFIDLLELWNARSSAWSVAVRRDGARVTFGVAACDTKTFFADRGLTVAGVSQRRAPIVHYVAPFERQLPTGRIVEVREHIRGEQLFDWQGYQCAVAAPQFSLTTWDFSVPSIEPAAAETRELLSMGAVVTRLADLEDSGQRRKPQE